MKVVFRLICLGMLFLVLMLGLVDTSVQTVKAEPNQIVLSSFTAKAKPGQKVKVKWSTGSETNVIGFTVWRANKANKPYSKLNTNLIEAKNGGGLEGAQYGFTDKTVKAGKNYFYKVEVEKTSPPNEVSDPVMVTAKP